MHFHQALLPWPILCSTYRSGKFQRNGEMHAMTMDKFTTKAQEALANAQLMAQAGQHGEVTPSHLLVAMLEVESGVATSLLGRAGAIEGWKSIRKFVGLRKRTELGGKSKKKQFLAMKEEAERAVEKALR